MIYKEKKLNPTKEGLARITPPASPVSSTTSYSIIADRLMTYNEVSEYLNISVRKIQEFVKNKQLKCVKIGRSVRFDATPIRDFIEERRGF